MSASTPLLYLHAHGMEWKYKKLYKVNQTKFSLNRKIDGYLDTTEKKINLIYNDMNEKYVELESECNEKIIKSINMFDDLLKKGKCLTELLKQFLYAPLSLANEVVSIFTGVHGYLETLSIQNIFYSIRN